MLVTDNNFRWIICKKETKIIIFLIYKKKTYKKKILTVCSNYNSYIYFNIDFTVAYLNANYSIVEINTATGAIIL